jgi:hypothetical protein
MPMAYMLLAYFRRECNPAESAAQREIDEYVVGYKLQINAARQPDLLAANDPAVSTPLGTGWDMARWRRSPRAGSPFTPTSSTI